MEREEIVTLIKAVKRQSGYLNRDLAKKMGIAVTRLSSLTSQGDMKLSTFIRLWKSQDSRWRLVLVLMVRL